MSNYQNDVLYDEIGDILPYLSEEQQTEITVLAQDDLYEAWARAMWYGKQIARGELRELYELNKGDI